MVQDDGDLARLKRGVSKLYLAGGRDSKARRCVASRGYLRGIAGLRALGRPERPPIPPPIHDTLDRSLDQSRDVEVALVQALAKAAAAGRYDVVLQLARRLEARPVRDACGAV